MLLFILFSLAMTIFTARTPEDWEAWLNSWFVEEDDEPEV